MDHPRSLREVCRLADNSELTEQYLSGYGFGASPIRSECNIEIRKRTDKVNYFRCMRCRKSATPNSLFLFARSHLSKGDMLVLGYLWLNKAETMKIVSMTGHDHKTVQMWTDRFREAITMDIQAYN